jgi:hypothetical protein
MPEAWFGGGREAWGRIAVKAVKGFQALRLYHLVIDLELTFLSPPPGAEAGWNGPLALSAEGWAGEGGGVGSTYLGTLNFREPLYILPPSWQRGFPAHLEARTPLPGQQVEAIEDLRKGGDLALRVDVHSVPLATAESGPYPAQIVHQVSQSEWVKVLDQFGYQETLLLEIPIPNPSEFPRMARVLDHLSQARGAIVRGGVGYREAVGLCRDALESLREALGDSAAEGTAWGKRSQDMEEMDKGERLLLVRRALWRLTSGARHPIAQWDRKEAVSVLAMVSAVVRIAAHQLGTLAPEAR